jgi:putative phage-type endonuclease
METTLDLERRRRGITGTDISAILGMNPWRGPFDVWLDKTGEGVGVVETDAMRWGKRLELAVATEFTENHPELGPMTMDGKTRTNAAVPMITGTPDALFCDEAHGLEVKTASFNRGQWGEPGSLDLPRHYYLQCLWYMAVMDWDVWHVSVLIGGHDYREYTINRDLEVEAKLIQKAQDFWENNVLANVAPDIDASPSVAKYLKAKYPTSSDNMLKGSIEQGCLFRGLQLATQKRKEFEDKEEELKNKLKFDIGGSAGIEFDTGIVTWKRSKDGKKTDWRKVATDAKATPEQIAEHTEVREGSRRFLVKVDK